MAGKRKNKLAVERRKERFVQQLIAFQRINGDKVPERSAWFSHLEPFTEDLDTERQGIWLYKVIYLVRRMSLIGVVFLKNMFAVA